MNRDEVGSLLRYYSEREQGGNGGLDYYFTPYSIQHGSGLGSFLSGLYRGLIPLISKGANFLAPHLMNAMNEVASDFSNNPSTSLKSSLKNRGLNALDNVASEAIKKMRGGRLGMVRTRNRNGISDTSKTIKKRKTRKLKTIKAKSTSKKSSVGRKSSTRTIRKRKNKPAAIEYPFFR